MIDTEVIKHNPQCEYFQWHIENGIVKIERCNHEESETSECNIDDCPIGKR